MNTPSNSSLSPTSLPVSASSHPDSNSTYDSDGEGFLFPGYKQVDQFDDDEEYDEVEEEDRFVNLALLSHLAVRLRDRVPRGTHVKGGIPYQRAFTGKDIVVRILGLLVLFPAWR